MLWIEAVRTLSADLEDPFELEFVWRNLHELDKLSWLNLMREKITDQEMIEMNYDVNVKQEDAAKVAERYLKSKGLI